MHDRWRGLEVFFAGVVALFTVALTGVSYYQWKVANRAAQAASESAQAAKESAQMAARANSLSEETSSPYLTIIKATLRPLHVGERPVVDASWENVGRLIAVRAGVGGMLIVAKTSPSTFNMTTKGEKLGNTPALLPQPAMFYGEPLTAKQEKDIAQEKEKLFLLVAFQWVDPFRKVQMYTAGCMVYDPQRPSDWGLGPCERSPMLTINGKPAGTPSIMPY